MQTKHPTLAKEAIVLSVLVSLCLSYTIPGDGKLSFDSDIPLDHWEYIEVDSLRGKYGDFGQPAWLKYFGLDMMDVTGDKYKDIVAGRYFYRNPGGDMTTRWERVDLGMNVDGMLLVDVDNDAYGDIIATALPEVYWVEAQDKLGISWKAFKIGEVPSTSHVNGQGYAKAQIVSGGTQEVLLATGKGIYYFEIPENDPLKEKWQVIPVAPEASDEGFGTGDIDGDGRIDIAAGLRQGTKEGDGMEIVWWKNPGNGEGNWKRHALGNTKFDADRIAVSDINGDGKADVVVTEERYPGPDPDAGLYWYEQPTDPTQHNWNRHTVVIQYSLNNLDVADMDGDGDQDIITAEHKGPHHRLQVWKNDGKGNFTEKLIDQGKESHLGARVSDLNSDGALDIVSIGWDKYKYLHVWRNDGLTEDPSAEERTKWKHFSSDSRDFAPPEVGNQSSTLVFDLDKDGKDEIIVAGWGETSMVWYKKKGNSWDRYLLDNTNSHIEAGGVYHDIDSDGDLDILHGGSWKVNEIWWWENPYPVYDPKKPWQKHTIKDTGDKQHHDQAIGDFDGDGKAELVFWNQQAAKMFMADIPKKPKDKNAWKFEEVWSWDGQLKYEGLAKGDINLDGKDDIVGGGFWFERNHKKYVARKIDDYGQSRSAVGDLIKGGRPEVVLGSGDGVGPLNIYQWKNDKWERTVLIDTVVHGHTLQVVDVDGDTNLDIFCAEMVLWHDGNNPGSKTWILYGDGKGNFTKEVLHALTDIGNHESKLGDVDGDGRPDIVQKPFMKGVPRLDIWLNQGPNTNSISIQDEIYENRPHFKIETKTVTYFFDKAGGGLSRVIDVDGTDWVNYNGDPHAVVPSGASGGYRGIPNMVFRMEDGGAGHPGFDQCISEKADEHTIRTRSKSGKWQWAWTFFDNYARLTIEKADPDRTYWFLYEGAVAGSFSPDRKYWGTDLGGPRYEVPSLNRGENIVDKWQWVYFGDKDTDRVFYVVQHPKDTLNDFFAYMGNTKEGNSSPDGMIVFGFGRDKGTKALETKTGVTYSIGFLDRKIMSAEDHGWVTQHISDLLNKE